MTADCQCLICKNTRLINLKEFESKLFIDYWADNYKIDVLDFFPQDTFFLKKCTQCSLEFFWPVVPAAGHVYDKLQEFKWYYEHDKDEFSYALNTIMKLKNIKNILDVGCGEGLFLKKLLNSYEVAGMEISEKSIEKLKQNNIQTNCTGRKYDFISAFQVLEHIIDPKSFIESILTNLNKDGHLLITVPNPDSKFIKENIEFLDHPPHHITRWDKNAFDCMAGKYNLEIVDYYLEPIRIEHYNAIINERRTKSIHGKFFNNIITRKIFSFFDKLILPYAIDFIKYSGHSHGVLFKNKN